MASILIRSGMVKLSIFILFLTQSVSFSFPPGLQGIGQAEKIMPFVVVIEENLERFAFNKTIPEEIRDVALLALSHYPELLEVEIDFQFQNKIRGSVMQAQPKIS